MSDHLIQAWLPDTPIHLDAGVDPGQETPLLWKVVLRTGTWKLRPGPGGVKLDQPLKIYRDKAPKGHISMAALKANFDAGAKEYVTVPQVHADGTTSDGGFVKKLVIQDVPGEDGSGVKESLLWAGMEITDSQLKTKLDERSIRGVSGGILFDYQRTEDAKKFDQILSHVMVTNSPWIGGTGDFQSQLPEGVMAAEPDDLPMGEVEFASRDTEPQVELPSVQLDDGSGTDSDSDMADPAGKSQPASGSVIWKPEQGFRAAQSKVQQALKDWRDSLMASVPQEQRYTLDWPYFSVDDVTLSGGGGSALVCSGYGPDKDSWVAGFTFDDDGDVTLDNFADWTPAKQEWVAASEDPRSSSASASRTSARPAGRDSAAAGTPAGAGQPPTSLVGLGLREAQSARAERLRLGAPSTTTGGNMGLLDLLSGVELSDEQREALLAQDRRLAGFEESETQRRERERRDEVAAYCGTADTEGVLDRLGLGDPGIKKYVRNVLLSDDGGPAIELSEHLDGGRRTQAEAKTATEVLKGFIDILPKETDSGRVALSEQARRIPDDPKPPETNPDAGDGKLDLSEDAVAKRAEELRKEMAAAGFGDRFVTTGGDA